MGKNKRPNQHDRSAASYGRSTGNRPAQQPILIVCEGAKTEPTYFGMLRQQYRLSSTQVEIVGDDCRSNPLAIVRHAEKLRTQKTFEAVWCVFDVETAHSNPEFPKAVALAKKKNTLLACSNPAFEFWLLLHFKQTTRPFADGQELEKQLKQAWPSYDKALRDVAALFLHTETAIAHAQAVLAQNSSPAEELPNPSTHVHQLVATLQTLKRF